MNVHTWMMERGFQARKHDALNITGPGGTQTNWRVATMLSVVGKDGLCLERFADQRLIVYIHCFYGLPGYACRNICDLDDRAGVMDEDEQEHKAKRAKNQCDSDADSWEKGRITRG